LGKQGIAMSDLIIGLLNLFITYCPHVNSHAARETWWWGNNDKDI